MRGFWKTGEPWIWLTGGALAASLIMVTALVLLILVKGLGHFWPAPVHELALVDGTTVRGEITKREEIPASGGKFRVLVKQGNRDLYGSDFLLVEESRIVQNSKPSGLVTVERREWGNFYGTILQVRDSGRPVAEGFEAGLAAIRGRLPQTERVLEEIAAIEKDEIGAVNRAQEQARLRLRGIGGKGGAEASAIREQVRELQAHYESLTRRIAELRSKLSSTAVLAACGGKTKDLPLAQIVRITAPNDAGWPEKLGVYFSRAWEFVWADPREANTEGGVFPAIYGTVMLVMIMTVFVTPLGVLGALYLREYARQGVFVSAVRIAVNNLAGVPSIVFGVFGVGFFIYTVGDRIDRAFFSEALPTHTFGTGSILWASLTLALLTLPVVIVSTEEGLAAIPRGLREASLALGATKFETTVRVVLPCLVPSIMTGLILAIARAAGEVAPLMLTGVVKLAPALPVDGVPPFVHPERKFMHLGFHIYDVGFQSPNVEAAQPMVYSTALLLLAIVVALNLSAIILRKRLKKKYAVAGV